MPLVTAQLGLLEDDLVYRLSMLAVNVLQPLKDAYPNIVVTSGLRQPNTGIGQHETGEAVDIQIRNQTDVLIYTVADYIQKRLPFDQLILNFSPKSDPWIHVSFSATSNRAQVQTKDFADTFHDGLFLVEPLTGEAAAAAQREQDALDAQILSELKNIQSRSQKLTVTIPEPTASGTANTKTGGPIKDHMATVVCVMNALNLPVGGPAAAFEVTKRVAWLLRDEGAGLYVKPSGDNIVSWNGFSFSAGRICFPDGRLIKVVRAIGAGSNDPGYDDNDFGDPAMYMPAMDPGDGEWLTCPV